MIAALWFLSSLCCLLPDTDMTSCTFLTFRLKIGQNLRKLKDSGRIVLIDGLASFDSQEDDSTFLENLANAIKHNLVQDSSSAKAGHLVIIDKLSLLISLGFPLGRIIKFTRDLQFQLQASSASMVTLVRSSTKKQKNNYEQDEMADRLSAYLSHTSHLNIIVTPLNTGKSADVSGNLSYTWADQIVSKKEVHRYHFRVDDKDIKVFAPGTSTSLL